MSQKTAVTPDKTNAVHPAGGHLRFVSANTTPEYNLPPPIQTGSSFGHDLSRVPTSGESRGLSHPAFPRTCPVSTQATPATGRAAEEVGAGGPSGGAPAGSTPGPSPAPAQTPTPAVPCAHPVNWVHGPGAVDHGTEAIRINITWQSSTGKLADLGSCQAREVVRYDPIPNPPFLWNPPNPTILTVPGTSGAGRDTHSYSPGLKSGITNPRVKGTAVAHQVYQWRCTAPGCPGTWTDFPGEAYDITREVYPQYVRRNPWRYRITKQGTGSGNTFKYSREVEVPEP